MKRVIVTDKFDLSLLSEDVREINLAIQRIWGDYAKEIVACYPEVMSAVRSKRIANELSKVLDKSISASKKIINFTENDIILIGEPNKGKFRWWLIYEGFLES